MFKYYLSSPGQRPPFELVAYHLWGDGCHFDSDGNDDDPPEGGWTELTVQLYPEFKERVDVDPLDDRDPLVLRIRSDSDELAKKTAMFLQSSCGGVLSNVPPR